MIIGLNKPRFEIHVLKSDQQSNVRVWENDPDTLSGKYVTDAIPEKQAMEYLCMRQLKEAIGMHEDGYAHRTLNDWWSDTSKAQEPGTMSAPEQRYNKPRSGQDVIREIQALTALIGLRAYADYVADGGEPTKLLNLSYLGQGKFEIKLD